MSAICKNIVTSTHVYIPNPFGYSPLVSIRPLILPLLLCLPSAFADWRDDMGLTALRAELGLSAPDGSGVSLSQVEAPVNPGGAYMVNAADPDLAGKTITNVSALNNALYAHATTVAEFYAGLGMGVATNLNVIDVYEALDWYGRVLLRDGQPNAEPLVESRDIQNHSWIARLGNGADPSLSIQINRLLDYQVQRDHVVSILTLDNDPFANIPDLLAHSYNTITVGMDSGNHSDGDTRYDSPGRQKPDIVGPFAATSFVAPMVSGAAALLIQSARDTPAWNAADDPRVIKSLLMSGARKDIFPSWQRTPTAPIDPTYGAGSLDIQTSHRILRAGEQFPGPAASSGWAFQHLNTNGVHRFFFSAGESERFQALHASLNWHREVWDSDPALNSFVPSVSLSDMSLSLYRASNGVATVLLDHSVSPVDNVEYLRTLDLGGGDYLLEVSTDLPADYALSWRVERSDGPLITAIAPGVSNVTLTAQVEPGYSYRVDSAPSPDGAWSEALPAQVITNGTPVFVVPTASPAHYRLRWLP
jgi:hypothetical protein